MARSNKRRIPQIPGDAELVLPFWAKTADWLEARKLGIGASEVGALLGVNEWATSFDVFKAKLGETLDLSGKPEVEWGHRLEDAVAKKAADELGLVARTGGGLWRKPDTHVLVTPDRLATRNLKWSSLGPIECKTAGSDEDWADGHAPLNYRAQLQLQLGVLGHQRGWLACLVLGSSRDFYLVEEKFDPEWFAEMVEVIEKFWVENVLPWEPPMFDLEHPHTDEILKEIHPKAVKPATELEDEAADWANAYHKAKDQRDYWSRQTEKIKNYFRMQLADAQRGYLGDDMLVSYPEVSPRQVSIEMLKEKYPEIAEECTVRSSHRRMTIMKTPEMKAQQAADEGD